MGLEEVKVSCLRGGEAIWRWGITLRSEFVTLTRRERSFLLG